MIKEAKIFNLWYAKKYINELEESIRLKDIEIERLRTQVNSLIKECAEFELTIKSLRDNIYQTAKYHMSRREPF